MSTQPNPQEPGGVPVAAPPHSRRRWVALVLLCTAFFMVVVDSTGVFAAVPSIQQGLGFDDGWAQWVTMVYGVAMGGLLLFCGRLADLWGRRRVFMAGLALFTAASLASGLAWSPEALIAARAAQGLGAAAMTPSALSLLMAAFPEGAERNRALGIWGALGGIGATVGLLTGGPITVLLGWEWIFFLNVPLGLAALVASPVLLAEGRGSGRGLDLPGAVTVTGGLLLLVYAILAVPRHGWASPATAGVTVLALVLLGAFVLVESRSVDPLVPLRLFRSRTLVGGNLVVLTAGVCVDGLLIAFTLYSQAVLGYSAFQFGSAMAVMTVTSFIGVMVSQHLVTRLGPRPVAVTGLLLIALACAALSRVTPESPFIGVILFGLAVFGPGMGAAFVSAQIAALSGVSEEDAGLASGVEESFFTIGGPLGVAVVSAVALAHTGRLLTEGTDPLLAQTDGFGLAFLVTAAIAAAGALGAALVLPRVRPAPSDVEPGRL